MVVNVDDPIVAAMSLEAKARLCEFSLRHEVPQGIYLEGEMVRGRLDGKADIVFERNEIPMRGQHNVANAMAAMSVGLLSVFCMAPAFIPAVFSMKVQWLTVGWLPWTLHIPPPRSAVLTMKMQSEISA